MSLEETKHQIDSDSPITEVQSLTVFVRGAGNLAKKPHYRFVFGRKLIRCVAVLLSVPVCLQFSVSLDEYLPICHHSLLTNPFIFAAITMFLIAFEYIIYVAETASLNNLRIEIVYVSRCWSSRRYFAFYATLA
jgi:hypothetical protein